MNGLIAGFVVVWVFSLAGSTRAGVVDGLVGSWQLDGNANDSSGSNNNGVVYGSPIWYPDGGARFDTVPPSYVDIPGSANWNFPSGFTLEADVRFTDITVGEPIAGKHIGTVAAGYFIGIADGHLDFWVNNSDLLGNPYYLVTSGLYNDDNWHRVVGTYDGATGLECLSVYDYDSAGNLMPIPTESLSETTNYYSFSPADFRIGTVQSLTPPGYISMEGDIRNVSLFGSVPEPSTFVLLAVAAIGVLGYVWRRKRA